MNYEVMNDYELVYLIREDNEDAYHTVIQKYHPIVSHIASSYLSQAKKYGLDYDDLYQAGLLGIHYAVTHYDENEKALLYTFVVLCVKGKIVNLLHSSSARRNEVLNQSSSTTSFRGKEVSSLDLLGTIDLTLDMVFTNDLKRELIFFQHRLPFSSSCVFELKINGFSTREISSLLELSPKTVNNILFQVKRKFVSYLKSTKYI